MKKVCLCLAFVLAAVCILCSCSDLPAPSTSETVNPSVDVTLKKWEDCGASIDKAEEISGIKFGESLENNCKCKSYSIHGDRSGLFVR